MFKLKGYSSQHIKIAISWLVGGTLCLTGYFCARLWISSQRFEVMKIRQELNEQYGIERIRERSKALDSVKD